MSVHSYPKLEIRLDYLRENTEKIVKLASEFGVEITGVIKGTTGIPECALMMEEGGDLREGFWERGEIYEAALMVEKQLPGLYLQGVGVNLGCYGSMIFLTNSRNVEIELINCKE